MNTKYKYYYMNHVAKKPICDVTTYRMDNEKSVIDDSELRTKNVPTSFNANLFSASRRVIDPWNHL